MLNFDHFLDRILIDYERMLIFEYFLDRILIDYERTLAQNLCSKRTESAALSLQKQAKHSQA